MAGGYQHTPRDIEALVAQMRDMQRQIDALRGAAAARNTTISGGAGLTVRDGGRFRVIDPDGDTIFDVGAFTEYAPRVDGKPQVGWVLRRDSGELVAYCITNVTGGKQSWNWLDISGNGIMADDAASEVGLARPYIPMPWGAAQDTSWLSTSSATYEDLYRAQVWRQHPRLEVSIGCWATTAGTTGDVRFVLDGTPIGPVKSATNGVILLSSDEMSVTAIGAHLTRHTLTIQARRTAGAGAIRVGMFGAWGIQS
ncbi:hypothetical protein [Kineosporia sp. R_H_3]|uniref:hypothetical protein n=1 Tax=Kineosporia sp. R_H_3 TaxID=1961848 RepID=UPI000B4B338F|nr:hypothetical protein [Kineosporia sp. R_H_3]